MAAVLLPEVNSIGHFDTSDLGGMGPRWKRWFRAFELYADGKGVTNKDQRRALLLHTAGMSVQDIFYTLPEGEGEDSYQKTVRALNQYFTPQVNAPYERHVFRSMSQQPGETIEQFLTRLRQKAETCEFGDANAIDEQLRDQVIEKCCSSHLRRKLLEKGKNLTLKQLREVARALEQSDRQAKSIEGLQTDVVNKLSLHKKTPGASGHGGYSKFSKPQKHNSYGTCFNCGKEGHKAGSQDCPARGQKCRYCKKIGHFERKCSKRQNSRKHIDTHKQGVHQVSRRDEERHGSSDQYAFIVVNTVGRGDGGIHINIGGVQINAVIDSGASCNIVDRQQWEYLKEQGVKCSSSKNSDKPLYAYGSNDKLSVAGTFTANVTHADRTVTNAEFIVFEGKGQSLLGRETALELGVLKLGSDVNMIDNSTASGDIQKRTLLQKYPKCFEGLGKLKNYQLTIPINGEVKPVVQPVRRIPYHLRDKVEAKLDELEELDIIEKTSGPSSWVSPVVVVPKKDGEIRLCVDMRQANTAVLRERHPIPTVDDVLQDLNDSTVFSKLDIKWAYHQIELSSESRDITTFVTHKGLYQYKRLMFGISCASEMYQKVMQQVLQGCVGVRNIMDDIFVHGSSVSEHNSRLERVVSVLNDSGLTLNSGKCQFNMPRLEFMGHILSARGIGPSEAKVQAVVDAREPQTVSEVKSFLGLVNYSARFIPNFATISAPLRKLTRNNVPFVWGAEEQNAFDSLKKSLAEAETLGYFKRNAPTQLITDASPVGLGAVLVQKQNSEYRVICYASRSLSDVERRYSQTEREALAIVWACERFHIYLYGTEFELLTDHKPLEYIYSTRSKPCARIERWVLRMQPYTYSIRYIPGKTNIADALSRLLSKSKPENTQLERLTESYIRFVAEESTPSAMTTKEIERASENDPELKSVRNHLLRGRWDQCEFKHFLPVRNELSAIGQLVLRGTRIVIPESVRSRVLELAHEGHPGIVGMKQRLRSKVWWPGIDRDVEKHCKTCYGCQLVSQPPRPEPLSRTALPSLPWQHLAADLLGPLPSGDYVLVVVDYYSRWFETEVTKAITSERITSIMSKMFVTHGFPYSVQTDNGRQFVSEHFQNFLKERGIVHRRTTPLWPQANGEVERQNRSIMKRVRIAQAQGRDWRSDLNDFLMMYRSTPHNVTGVSPAKLMFGRNIRTKLPELHEFALLDDEVRDRDSEKKEKGKIYTDRKRGATEHHFYEGDRVLLKQDKQNKLTTPFNPKPFTVVEKTGNSVVVESDDGAQYRRNSTHVKRFHENVQDAAVNDSNSNLEPLDEVDTEPTKHPLLPKVPVSADDESCHESVPKNKSSDDRVRESRPVRTKKLPVRFDDFVLVN